MTSLNNLKQLRNVEQRRSAISGSVLSLLFANLAHASRGNLTVSVSFLLHPHQTHARRVTVGPRTGTKFAVASGAKTVAVSRLDTSQSTEWYVSRLMKGHKSTVRAKLAFISVRVPTLVMLVCRGGRGGGVERAVASKCSQCSIESQLLSPSYL